MNYFDMLLATIFACLIFGYQDLHLYSQWGTVLCLLGSTALVLMFPIFQRKGQRQLVPKGNILDSQMRSLLSCSGKIFSECISPQWLKKKAFGTITGILQMSICHNFAICSQRMLEVVHL